MKKFMMTLAAVLCCAMTMTLFTACSDDEQDSVSNYAAYDVSAQGSGNVQYICDAMRDALKTGMPLDEKMCKRNDEKAISICDKVYQELKSYANANFKITLVVTPFGNGVNNKAVDLKTYEF